MFLKSIPNARLLRVIKSVLNYTLQLIAIERVAITEQIRGFAGTLDVITLA